jgi:hypothetical protein
VLEFVSAILHFIPMRNLLKCFISLQPSGIKNTYVRALFLTLFMHLHVHRVFFDEVYGAIEMCFMCTTKKCARRTCMCFVFLCATKTHQKHFFLHEKSQFLAIFDWLNHKFVKVFLEIFYEFWQLACFNNLASFKKLKNVAEILENFELEKYHVKINK